MEPRETGYMYTSDSFQNPSIIIKKRSSTPRSTSLFGISNYNSDKYERYGASNNYNNHRYSSQYSEAYYPFKMTSIIERRSSSADKEESRDNFSSVLREKMPNNEIYNYNEPWLCEVDVFQDKLRIQHLLNSKNQKQYSSRYRYSESEKDKSIITTIDDSYKRRIRARSESEPNDISNMKYWIPSRELSFQRDDKIYKPNDDSVDAIHINAAVYNMQNEKLPPLPISNFNKEKPTRNTGNNLTKHSFTSMKKPERLRSPSIVSSPHLGRIRRCKTKSPSPISRTKSLGPMSPFRKAKSATPPPRSRKSAKEVVSSKSSQSSVVDRSVESDGSSLEEEDDDDFEEVTEDDCGANTSSDSDDGYKAHAYLCHTEKILPTTAIQTTQSIVSERINSPFAPSLFPYVPPYLVFSTHIEKGPPMPLEVHKVLKWKLTSVMPRVVRHIVLNSGFRLLKKTNDWMGTWGKHMKSPCFKAVRSHQKINHLPGSFKIGRKDSCWKNLQKQMGKHGKKEFGFMPKTYIIPQDLKALRKAWPRYAQRNFKWIIKPPASARGTGIKVINRWTQIPKRKPVIVQRYIEKPLLINGSKFDLRLYVLVTSINPLRVYMYHDGLARFASVKYSDRPDTLNDRCMHLTNYSINKFSSNYHKNEDVNACHGHKWTLKSLWSYLSSRGINTTRLWAALRNLVLRTILAGENAIHSMIKMNVESKYSCFELFGFDVLLDSDLIPWLLEVNISPSLHSELPLDLHVKAPLVQAVLNTALYNVPPKLSIEQQKEVLIKQGLEGPLCYDKRMYITYLSRVEKLKHSQFTRRELEDRDEYINTILENLTPDDIRCLIVSEDELSRCAPLERIFPTENTYKYLKYTENPRYYNRLLDAWEYRYGSNRIAGIELLRSFCEQKYHLEVPPSPVKRTLKIRTQTLKRAMTETMKTRWKLLNGRTMRAKLKLIKQRNHQISSMRQKSVNSKIVFAT